MENAANAFFAAPAAAGRLAAGALLAAFALIHITGLCAAHRAARRAAAAVRRREEIDLELRSVENDLRLGSGVEGAAESSYAGEREEEEEEEAQLRGAARTAAAGLEAIRSRVAAAVRSTEPLLLPPEQQQPALPPLRQWNHQPVEVQTSSHLQSTPPARVLSRRRKLRQLQAYLDGLLELAREEAAE